MIDYKNAAYISAQKSGLPAHVNALRHAALGLDLQRADMTLEQAIGVYQGVRENSYIIAYAFNLAYIERLARQYQQESVLYVSGGMAALQFLDREYRYQRIGRLVVSRSIFACDGDRTETENGDVLRVIPDSGHV